MGTGRRRWPNCSASARACRGADRTATPPGSKRRQPGSASNPPSAPAADPEKTTTVPATFSGPILIVRLVPISVLCVFAPLREVLLQFPEANQRRASDTVKGNGTNESHAKAQSRKGDSIRGIRGHSAYWQFGESCHGLGNWPRTARASVGRLCYHVLNRGNGRADVSHEDGDFAAFLQRMADARVRFPMRILGIRADAQTYSSRALATERRWPLPLGGRIARRLSLESTLHPRGRPRKANNGS